ncbi:MAG: GNAT family N-acetyltransferase [Acidobacteria bacterium]|nr:GNAT family N-acetyltransferase [Acidobacteriota bacterium]
MVSLPFADHCEPLIENSEEFEEILSTVRRSVERREMKYVEIRPLSSHLSGESGLREAGEYWLHTLDLRPSLEDLFRGLHKDSIQRKIRRAERESLQYEQGRSKTLQSKFYQLLLLTRRRHGLPPQPFEWFHNLSACMGGKLTIHVASKEGRAIAGILTLRHGQTLVYKYGGSDANFHHLGSMPFLFWKAIEEAKRMNLAKLDMGRTDSDNSGLTTFKDRLGATRSNLAYLKISRHAKEDNREGMAKRIAKQLLGRMPNGVLISAGRLLYKHMG